MRYAFAENDGMTVFPCYSADQKLINFVATGVVLLDDSGSPRSLTMNINPAKPSSGWIKRFAADHELAGTVPFSRLNGLPFFVVLN
jgi:hypothetical protein